MDEALRAFLKDRWSTPEPGLGEAMDLGLFSPADWALTEDGERYVEVLRDSLSWKITDLAEAIEETWWPARIVLRRRLERLRTTLAEHRDAALRRYFES
ncbi:MAG: hypothetical protein AAGA42_14340 [Actinomycetota bacterium]